MPSQGSGGMILSIKFVVPCVDEQTGVATAQAALDQLSDAANCSAVVVVDNAGEDTLSSHNDAITVIRNSRCLGSYSSRNKGAFYQLDSSQWLCFLDDDVRLLQPFSGPALAAFDTQQLYSGHIEFLRDAENSLEHWYVKHAFDLVYFRDYMGFFPTLFLLVHGSLFKKVNGFDELLFTSGDLDFCRRASNNDRNRLVLLPDTKGVTSLRTAPKIILKYKRLFYGQSLLAKISKQSSGIRYVGGYPYLLLRCPASFVRLLKDAVVEAVQLQPTWLGSLCINSLRVMVSIRVLFMSTVQLRRYVEEINGREISKN
jgi:GT2 family glycosyltransferase